jgi:hypothetical protein
MTVTKTFTIALLACAIAGTAAVSAQQKDQSKEKAGTFSQPSESQPVVMPAGQRPEEWKFQSEKERDANKAVEDKKAAKKKAEEDKKAAAEAKKKDEAERKLAAKAAKEEAEKKRVEERRAAADKKKADEAQRAADAREEREAGATKREADASKRAEEQKAADERRALERRAAAEEASEKRKADAERAAEEVRMKEAEKKAAAEKSTAQKSAAKQAAPAAAAPAPAPASSAPSKQAPSQAAAGQKPADTAKQADGAKPAVDPVRPPAVIRSGEQPDAWKMSSEKPRAEGAAAGQNQAEKGKSSDTKSASSTTGQRKPDASAPPKPKEPWRGWSDRALISLNAGWQSASFDLRDTRNFEPPLPGDREQRTLAADYSVKSGMSLDLGGGFRVWRGLAAGVSVTRFEDSRDVPISGSVPHPFFFNRARPITGVTSGAREEMAVHVDAMWVIPIRQKMTLAIFGGPSFYSVKQTVVSDFDYNQSYPYDEVTLTNVVTADESSSVTGINVGADVGYYFTNTIGVGGVIRFGRASVDTSIGSIDVGGPEFGVGLRIRIPQGRPRGRAVTPQPPPTTR